MSRRQHQVGVRGMSLYDESVIVVSLERPDEGARATVPHPEAVVAAARHQEPVVQ